MMRIMALARKDLRILFRVRSGLFFTFVWPIIVAVLFGVVFAGQSQSAPPSLRVVLVDEDNSEGSRAFVATLKHRASSSSTARRVPMPRSWSAAACDRRTS